MTKREEEINKQALRYGEPEYLLQTPNILGIQGFTQSAKWADKTMIDKACEWLLKNTYKHVDDSRVYMTFTNTVDMIEDFRRTLLE